MPYIQTIPQDLVKEKLLAGQSMASIATDLKCSRQRIFQLAKKFGIDSMKLRQENKAEAFRLKNGNKDGSDFWRVCRRKFSMKKCMSKRIGIEWNLQFGELNFPTHCPILDLELDYFAESTQENSPSFDRIDSSRGYISGNVQIISWRANRIKNDGTPEEHRKIADYLENQRRLSA